MRKHLSRIIPMYLALILLLSPGLFITSGAESIAREIAPEDVISPRVLELFHDEGHVQVLVKLSARADSARAAGNAVKNLPLASRQEKKQAAGEAVVAALKAVARSSQRPLLEFLQGFGPEDILDLKTYYIVNIIYLEASEEVIRAVAEHPGVEAVFPNSRILLEEPPAGSVSLHQTDSVEWNVARIRAPEVWDAYGVDGRGVVVGIIDTGVFWEHEALKEKWRGYNPADPDNPDPNYNWYDPVYGWELPRDIHGHGTHVTGTVAGSGPPGGSLIGVAPGARWVAVNAFTRRGNEYSAYSNDLLAAGEYLLAPTDSAGANPRPDLAPDIINNSWGGEAGLNEWFREMVQNWRAAGILPVFSAGNSGPGDGTVSVPANYPESLAVAATDSGNQLAGFSSRGPGPYPGIKPEISAPGVSIRSSARGGGYEYKSGTSMAAPHIAGAAALLLSGNPELSGPEAEAALLAHALPLTNGDYPESPNYGYGYGLVDVMAAAKEVFYETGGPVGIKLHILDGDQHHRIWYGQTEFEPVQFEVTLINKHEAVEVEIEAYAPGGDWEGNLVWPEEAAGPESLAADTIAFQFSTDGIAYNWLGSSGGSLDFAEETHSRNFWIKAFVGEGTRDRYGPVVFRASLR